MVDCSIGAFVNLLGNEAERLGQESDGGPDACNRCQTPSTNGSGSGPRSAMRASASSTTRTAHSMCEATPTGPAETRGCGGDVFQIMHSPCEGRSR
jgi:hypothetical protein